MHGGVDFHIVETTPDFLNPKRVFNDIGIKKILDGIIGLQEKGLVHCDIKNQNIVCGYLKYENYERIQDLHIRSLNIDMTANYRLIDFGLLSFANNIQDVIDNYQLPPEQIQILNNKDILSGPAKRLRFTNLKFDYQYYPPSYTDLKQNLYLDSKHHNKKNNNIFLNKKDTSKNNKNYKPITDYKEDKLLQNFNQIDVFTNNIDTIFDL
jgi:hypothetical protein